MENENLNSQEEQNTTENVQSEATENNENKQDEFDASAFSTDSTESKASNTSTQNTDTEDNTDDDSSTDSDDDFNAFSWDNYESDTQENTDNENVNSNNDSKSQQDENNNVVENVDKDNSTQPSSLTDDTFKAVASELGLEANNLQELKETLQQIDQENKDLRSQLASGVDNDEIKKFKSLKAKEDKELLLLDLRSKGFSEEEAQEAVDVYSDNGTLRIEAKKIRNQLDSAIVREQNKAFESDKQAQARQEQETQEAIREITEQVNSMTEMFGFAITSDESKIQGVRENHLKYITSGDFLGDVTKNAKNLTEAAWLWKNKDKLLKAIGTREFNKGRQDVIDDISNPDVSDKTRHRDPEGSDSFDPKKFAFG